MKTHTSTQWIVSACAAATLLFGASALRAADITRPGDPIVITSGSTPGAEAVPNAIDNNRNTKYLNFNGPGTGLIVTPSVGSSVVKGISLVSANDSPDRDPTSFSIEGSNDGGGLWTPVASGAVPAFPTRFSEQVIMFANAAAYTSYRVLFPTLNGGPLMQIAEVQLLDGAPARPHVGVNFMGRADPRPSLAAGEYAGVLHTSFVQANWNNINNDDGALGANNLSDFLNDRNGDFTPLSLRFEANDSWNNDGPSNFPDERLMRGIIKAGNPAGTVDTFTFLNVPQGTYDLVLYANVNSDGTHVDFTATTSTGPITYYIIEQHQFGFGYVQAVNTTDPALGGVRDTGNYVVINNVVPNANGQLIFTMTHTLDNTTDGTGLAAVQILATAPRPLSVVGAGPNSVRVTYNTTVTSSGGDPDSYSIAGLSITGVALDAGGTVALLTTADQTPNTTYTLTINGVSSTGAETIAPNTKVSFKSTFPFDIPMNFTGGYDGANGPTPLAFTDVAGVVPTAGWNNIDGNVGNSTLRNNVALNYADGAASPVTFTFKADEQWVSGTGAGDPNRKLLNGYFGFANENNVRPVYIDNLPEGHYTLIAYTLRDGSGEPEGFTVNGDTANTLHVRSEAFTDWNNSPAFRRGTSTDPNNRQLCNYVQFDGVTPINGTITLDARSEAFRSPVNGIQLIYTDAVAIQLTSQPVDTAVGAGSSFSFSVTAVGSGPRTIQWMTNGVAIAGANSLTFTGTAQTYMNGLHFSVSVGNSVNTVVSDEATLVVAPVPVLLAAGTLDSFTQICLRFSKPMDGTVAADTSHYAVNNGVTVSSAALAPSDSTVVVLNTTTMNAGTAYQVTITGLTDTEDPANTIFPNPTITSVTPGGYAATRIESDRFSGIGGNTVADLTGNPNYPNNPNLRLFNPAFFEIPTNVEESYGSRTWGIYIAPSTGNYRFAISADDNAAIFLATDADPAHKVQIAREESWNGVRSFGTATRRSIDPATSYLRNQSALIALTAGQRVYLEALQKEGGGGDNMAVAVQLPPGTGAFTDGMLPIANDQFEADSSRLTFNGAFYIPGPVTLTQQPATANIVEGQSATFTINFIGTPPTTVTWYSNDVVIAGATGKSITIAGNPGNNGAVFRARVVNLCSAANSDPATLNVELDLIKPTIASAGCDPGADKQIVLVFSEPVTIDTATFSIDGGLVIDSATLLSDNKTVILVANSALTPNDPYVVHVSGAVDRSLSLNVMEDVDVPIKGCVCKPGVILAQMYRGNAGANNFTTVTNNPKFPNSPDNTYLLSSPNWGQTPNAFWPNQEENYTVLMKGFLIPATTGNYRFSVHADDSAQLFVSTDHSRRNLQRAIYAPGDCGACTAQTSAAIPLNAGQTYYFEASFQEGGGGDYLEVQWQLPGTTAYVYPTASELQYCVDPLTTFPITITGPFDTTAIECHSVTLSAVVSAPGQSVTYQWLKDGSPIQDKTNATLTIASPQQAADSGSYSLRVNGLLGDQESQAAVLTVLPDEDVPTLVSAVGDTSLHHAFVTFSEAVDPNTATDPTLYTIVGEDQSQLNISGNPILVAPNQVMLTTVEEQVAGLLYTISVGQGEGTIYDLCIVHGVEVGANVSFHAWKFIPCLFTFQTFETGPGVLVGDLTSNPNFPNNPRETRFISGFNSRLAYPDDGHENYGGRMFGYVTPPFTGNFIFYVSSDDGSELLLNSNPDPALSVDPAGAVQIATEPTCCRAFSAVQSAPIALNGGQRYYIEGRWKEGGGGDYMLVAAAPPGLTAAQADALAPLGPEYLGTIGNPDAIPTLPTSSALPLGSLPDRGFDVHLHQVNTNIDNSLAIAEQLLAGQGGANIASLSYFYEPNVVNYNIFTGGGDGNLRPDALFPGIPGTNGGSTDNITMEVLTYIELTAGYHCMIVNSDDGFRVTPATCAADPNNSMVLGQFDGGRGASDSPFIFNVPADGLYPFRLIWEQGGGGANVEWVDIQPSLLPSARVAVNGNNSIKAYSLGRNRIKMTVSGSNLVLSWGAAGLCQGYRLQGTDELKNPSSATIWNNIDPDVVGGTTATIAIGSGNKFFRLISTP